MSNALRQCRYQWRRVLRATGCAVPPAIRDDLARLQHDRIGALIPILYLTIATITIVAASASGGGFDVMYHAILPGGFLGMGMYRCLVWYRRGDGPVDLVKVRRHLRSTTWLALIMGLVGGLWTLDAYYTTIEARRILAPVFIFMITFAGAICLNSLPRAAIGVMVSALTIPTVAMILSNDMGIRAMGISLMIVSWLMTGFIIHNFAQTVSSLKLSRKLQLLAGSDALTGLANRRAFEMKFTELTGDGALAEETDGEIVLTMIDLDGFKQANDHYGHPAGDAVLIEVAKRLRKICPRAPCVARLGGDEFAIISASQGDAEFYEAQREAIRVAISLPHQWEGQQITVSASLGMATYPRDGASLSELLKHSDQALYAEKAKTLRRRVGDDRYSGAGPR